MATQSLGLRSAHLIERKGLEAVIQLHTKGSGSTVPNRMPMPYFSTQSANSV